MQIAYDLIAIDEPLKCVEAKNRTRFATVQFMHAKFICIKAARERAYTTIDTVATLLDRSFFLPIRNLMAPLTAFKR